MVCRWIHQQHHWIWGSLVAMPFVATSIPLEIAVPASTLIVLTLNLQVSWNYRKYIRWKNLRYLFIGGVFGTAMGVLLMKNVGNETLKLGMGLFMIAYAAYSLFTKDSTRKPINPRWGVLAGFASTTLGALFGFNGPPLAIFVSCTKWPQEAAKGILGSCFVMTGTTILLGQIVAGVQNLQTLAYYAAGCPGALIGGAIGLFISRYLSQQTYNRITLLLVIVSGASISLSCFNS